MSVNPNTSNRIVRRKPSRHFFLSPIQRVQIGALVLASAVIVGTVGYRFLGDYGWVESLWMVVITISTVGYGEHSESAAAVQLLTIVMILLGMSSAVYTFTGAIQLALEGELERTFGARRMTRHIEKLTNHVIICGMGRSGRSLAEDLERRGREFIMIDHNEAKLEELAGHDYAAIVGDATEEATLERAGIERAQVLVSALPSDADNVFITLTAREMNPKLMIIASAEKGIHGEEAAPGGCSQSRDAVTSKCFANVTDDRSSIDCGSDGVSR